MINQGNATRPVPEHLRKEHVQVPSICARPQAAGTDESFAPVCRAPKTPSPRGFNHAISR